VTSISCQYFLSLNDINGWLAWLSQWLALCVILSQVASQCSWLWPHLSLWLFHLK
jgi:hypothetical protein